MITADIIIIRGAPGTGKTTISKELAKLFPNGSRVEVDTVRLMKNLPNWTNQEEHITMLKCSATLISNFLKNKFCPVIVVDTLSGNKTELFRKLLNELNPNAQQIIFTLLCSEIELKTRIDARKVNEFRNFDICLKQNCENKEVVINGNLLVDTSSNSILDTVRFIYEKIVLG